MFQAFRHATKQFGQWILGNFIWLFKLNNVDLTPLSQPPQGIHARGLVTAVDNSLVRQNLIVRTEEQFLTVRLLDGPQQGQEIAITNMLTGNGVRRVLRSG